LQRCLAAVRSLPEVLVIFMVYYGSSILMGQLLLPFGGTGFVNVNAFAAGLMSLSFIHGAYASEVFRGALANVPRGVMEAAASLGLPPIGRFLLVELPIAVRHAMPGLVNLVVISLKVTPFLSIIGLQDLLRTATDAARNTKDYVSFYVVVLLIYLTLTSILYLVQIYVERRLETARVGG
jgi:ABC-type arginine transport system permease subunit